MKWLSNVFKESLEQILKETKVNLDSVLHRRVSPKQPSKYFSYLIISSSSFLSVPSTKSVHNVKGSILAQKESRTSAGRSSLPGRSPAGSFRGPRVSWDAAARRMKWSIIKNNEHETHLKKPQLDLLHLMKQKLSLALILVLRAVLYVGSKSWWSQRLFWNITSNDALMFTYSNTSLSLNSLLRYSHPIFDQPGPGDVMIYSIFFKFPASWWITSHRLLTSSTTSVTFSALHGTHVKVPKNNDIMDLVISSQRLDESYHIVHSLLQQRLPLSLRCTVLKHSWVALFFFSRLSHYWSFLLFILYFAL